MCYFFIAFSISSIVFVPSSTTLLVFFFESFVLSGSGLVGLRNEAPKIINAGDTVWIPPGEEHWHGASETNSMVHIAIQEALYGQAANWLEKVSDDEYLCKMSQTR